MAVAGARLAGVMGWPIAHSRSPRLHGYWLARYDVDGAYVKLDVRAQNLARALTALPWLGFAGANLTVPHKEAALGLVDRVDDNARRIGAINTVVVELDGTLSGSNTDAYGFIENLRAGAPAWKAADGPATVIGAGGAARAVVVALIDAGVAEIRLVNRTPARAEKLARDLGGPIAVRGWETRAEALADAVLVVNTTTQGMSGQVPLDLDLARLPRQAVVNDIVYVPLATPLIKAAQARGNTVVDGLGMLLHQGRPGFRAWFGVDPQVTPALRAHVAAGLGA
ncbi:MAG: shikimate dehydrogenase [Pseudomonadota bacterium]